MTARVAPRLETPAFFPATRETALARWDAFEALETREALTRRRSPFAPFPQP